MLFLFPFLQEIDRKPLDRRQGWHPLPGLLSCFSEKSGSSTMPHSGLSPLPSAMWALALALPPSSTCNPVDYSPPASSVHGIFQARVLEWVDISSFRGIFLIQGSNPNLLHLLHWQVGSLPLSHLGSPNTVVADDKFRRKAMNKGYISPRGGFNDNQARHRLITDIYLFITHR